MDWTLSWLVCILNVYIYSSTWLVWGLRFWTYTKQQYVMPLLRVRTSGPVRSAVQCLHLSESMDWMLSWLAEIVQRDGVPDATGQNWLNGYRRAWAGLDVQFVFSFCFTCLIYQVYYASIDGINSVRLHPFVTVFTVSSSVTVVSSIVTDIYLFVLCNGVVFTVVPVLVDGFIFWNAFSVSCFLL